MGTERKMYKYSCEWLKVNIFPPLLCFTDGNDIYNIDDDDDDNDDNDNIDDDDDDNGWDVKKAAASQQCNRRPCRPLSLPPHNPQITIIVMMMITMVTLTTMQWIKRISLMLSSPPPWSSTWWCWCWWWCWSLTRWTGVSGTCQWEFATSTWPWMSSAPPRPYST